MIYECCNCDFTTTDVDVLDFIQDFGDRVQVGEINPAGQCPECGALVPALDEEVADNVGLDYMASLMRSLGWTVVEPSK